MQKIKTSWKYYQISSAEQNQKNWADCIKSVCTMHTYPELLYVLDQTKKAGLENFLDLNFFKDSIMPMWEDSENVNGGRIIMEVPQSQKDILHSLWARTVVFCSLEPTEGINGCVFAEKANYRICIWISNPSVAEEVANAWRHVLNCNSATFTFTLHNRQGDNSKYKRNYSKNKSRF